MWGTDMTAVMTGEGQAAVFVAVDHCSAECLGTHASRDANRFEALEPVRQAVRRCRGSFRRDVAAGLRLRHDHGSRYVSHDFQAESRFLGTESSPAFVREPEGNGCAERFVRTLKGNLSWLRRLETVEEPRPALRRLQAAYNRTWIIERHGYRTPAQVRADQRDRTPMAARAQIGVSKPWTGTRWRLPNTSTIRSIRTCASTTAIWRHFRRRLVSKRRVPLRPPPGKLRVRIPSPRLLPEQELAPDLDPLLAVVRDDVGGGVSLGPLLRQVAAGADDVDRRLHARHQLALGGAEAGAGDDLDVLEAGLVQALAGVEDRGRGDAGAGQPAQLLLGAVGADGERGVALEHVVAGRHVEALDEAAAVGVEADAEAAGGGEVGEALADREGVRDLPAEIVDQNGERVVGEDLVEHLGRPQRATGVADQGVRHGAEALRLAEEVGGRVGGVADEALGPGLLARPLGADARGVGHQLGHLRPGAVARVHGEEADIGQVGAHAVGVERGDAGAAELLEQDGLEVDEVAHRAGDVHHGLAGPDPVALLVEQLDLDLGPALGLDRLQPVERQPRRAQDRAPHEDGVDDPAVAEALDDRLGLDEVLVAEARDVAVLGIHAQSPLPRERSRPS